MAYDTQVVECVRDEHEGTASSDAPPRERWSWTAWVGVRLPPGSGSLGADALRGEG